LATPTAAGPTDGSRWQSAPPYLRRHAIQHAVEAGRIDELLGEPEFLVYAEPSTLMAELDHASSPDGQLTAAIYRTSVGVHRHTDADTRRRLLAIDAIRYRRVDLARRITADPQTGTFAPRWATGA